MECESEPPWSGEPERRSGSDETELVSSLESKPLSLELSVGNRSSYKMEGSPALWPESYHGKAFLCTGDIFPWIPGDYKTAPSAPRLLTLEPRFLCRA